MAYGIEPIFNGLDLHVKAGELVAVIGPSGSGKSTLLNTICGFIEPKEGMVFIDDSDVTFRPAHKRNISYMPDTLSLYPHMTVMENIGYPLKVAGVKKKTIAQETTILSEALGIRTKLHDAIGDLSLGQTQRVALAKAMLKKEILKSTALLCDEPFSACDTLTKRELRILFKNYQRGTSTTTDTTTTCLFVTHDQDEAFALGDRILVLNDGRVEQFGSAEDIIDRPATSFVAKFVGNPGMNVIAPRPQCRWLDSWMTSSINPPNLCLDDVTFGVRPQDLEIVEPDPHHLVGRVVAIEKSSRHLNVVCDTEAGTVVVSTPKSRFSENTMVGVRPNLRSVHCFRKSDGARV